MYCYNCGKQLPDGSAFCTNCGTKVGEAAPAPAPQPSPDYVPEPPPIPDTAPAPGYYTEPQQPNGTVQSAPMMGQVIPPAYPPAKKKSKKKAIILSVIALLLVAAIGICAYLWFTGAKRKAVDAVKFDIESYTTHMTADKYCSFYPPEYLEKSAQESGMTLEEAKAELQKRLDQQYEYVQQNGYADQFKLYSCDVVSERSYSAEELEDLREKADFKFDEAKVVIMKVHAMIEGEDKTFEKLEAHVVRCGLKWYINPYMGISEAKEEAPAYEDWDY